MNKQILPIGQAAAYLGVSIITLRRWSDAGKIKPSLVTPGGHRYYNIEDLDRLTQNIFILAKDWVFSKNPINPPDEYFCEDSQIFQFRLNKLETILKEDSLIAEEFSLISSIVGEIGNNSFDHNLGLWTDIRGIFFAYDHQKRKIVIADRGQGIQKTLKRVRPKIKNDEEALKIAFTEIVSGRAPENRGNGLKYVRSIIKDSIKSITLNLSFQSGSAILTIKSGADYKISKTDDFLQGCLIKISY